MLFGILQKPYELAWFAISMVAKEEADSQIHSREDKQPLTRASRLVVTHVGIV